MTDFIMSTCFMIGGVSALAAAALALRWFVVWNDWHPLLVFGLVVFGVFHLTVGVFLGLLK